MMSDENESLRWKNKKLMKIQLCEIIILMNQLKSKIKKMREIKISYNDENYLSKRTFITLMKIHHGDENSLLLKDSSLC